MPLPRTLMLNFTIPVLSGHLAIPRGWPLNTGFTVLKRRKSQKRKLTSGSNELMYNFLLVLRALIANRFFYICDWEGRETERGGARRQETLPVGSGGAGQIPTVSWSSAGNGESWILRRVSAGICASGKRKQELMSLIVESGTCHYLNAWNRLRVDEPIRWLSKKNSSVSNENKTIQRQNLSLLLTRLIQASSSMFA